jgi:uncharacterized protein
MQQIVDETPTAGRFILTGSQNFALSSTVSQSLAGRVGMVTLLPLSLHELKKAGLFQSANDLLFKGGYPGLHKLSLSALDFYPSYIATYVERDIRQLQHINNLSIFQKFLSLCAGRVGQILNYSSLGNDCGISHNTVRQWLSLLESSYLAFVLPSFHKNYSKRLIKMPKLYFYDVGLACRLLGIEAAEQLTTHYMRGALWENSVILELIKSRYHKGLPPNLSYWRDVSGHEIDCIAEWGSELKILEIKAGSTIQPNFFKGLKKFQVLDSTAKPYLVYDTEQNATFMDVTLLSPWSIYEMG